MQLNNNKIIIAECLMKISKSYLFWGRNGIMCIKYNNYYMSYIQIKI